MGELAGTLLRRDPAHQALFNALPRRRSALVDSVRDPSAGHIPGLQEYNGRQLGFLDLPAGGYTSYQVATSASSASIEVALPGRITTKYYDVDFAGGLIAQISVGGKGLLSTGEYLGGEIRALVSDTWHDNREAECRFFEGEACYILERSAAIASIPLRERYFFYRNERAIKVELDFEFSGDEVGVFWFDETKVNVYYPGASREIHHDIPFGFVEGREARPLFASNWLACGGLVYVNRGTVKHWVRNGVMANILAWGGNIFGNRLHFDFWASKREFDLRIHQPQSLEYFIVPFEQFDGRKVVRQVSDLTTPVFVAPGKGSRSVYKSDDKAFAVTSVFRSEGEIRARGYRLPKGKVSRPGDFHIETRRIGR